mmetsp:Transcript_12742/g.27559  ORF Transcript_12742/g.27559 Transcript_12742/m.27559 type:complete len:304 (+) Transcript_12742:114-1025(+)
MADGGTLPWRVQKIDESRGPAGDYSAIHKPLPDPGPGVSWHRDESSGEWSLVRSDEGKEKIKYKLRVGETWHVRAGRAAPTLVSVPVDQHEQVLNVTVEGTGTDGPTTDAEGEDGDGEGKEQQQQQEEKRPAIEGEHYLMHTILPTDTFSGLCLRYRIKPHVLRRINRFSGSNLRLAPHSLIIPLGPNGEGLNGGTVRVQDTSCPEFKLHALQAEFPSLRHAECKAYLELADWDLEEAKKAAADDDAWECEEEAKRLEKERREARKKVVDVHVAVPVDAPSDGKGDGGLTEPLLRHFELPCVT